MLNTLLTSIQDMLNQMTMITAQRVEIQLMSGSLLMTKVLLIHLANNMSLKTSLDHQVHSKHAMTAHGLHAQLTNYLANAGAHQNIQTGAGQLPQTECITPKTSTNSVALKI